jgi:hypothetical protein
VRKSTLMGGVVVDLGAYEHSIPVLPPAAL